MSKSNRDQHYKDCDTCCYNPCPRLSCVNCKNRNDNCVCNCFENAGIEKTCKYYVPTKVVKSVRKDTDKVKY